MQPGDLLRLQAFDNSTDASMIFIVQSGKLLLANRAASKLFGYSKKDLFTKNRKDLFDTNGPDFKKMMRQRKADGQTMAMVTGIKKNGQSFPCEISAAIFLDEQGIKKSITTVRDWSQHALDQQIIDTKKEKLVKDNIMLVQAIQKGIDKKQDKKIASDIVIAKTKQKAIDVKKDKAVASDIVQAKKKQRIIDIRKEKKVADDIVLVKSNQKVIDVKNNEEAEAREAALLLENTVWKKYAGKTSYDVMWDMDIATGGLFVGESIKEVFGYTVKENKTNYTNFTSLLDPGQKAGIEKKLSKRLSSVSKTWNDSFMLKCEDGTQAATNIRASIIRDQKGKAIHLIGAIQNVTRLRTLEKQLGKQLIINKEDSEKFQLAARLSFDVIWDWNLANNEIFIGEGFEELFGYTINHNKGLPTDWSDHIHPDDRETVEKELHDAIVSSATRWEYACRFIRADGSIAKILGRASILRHPNGRAYRLIGAMQDLSRQKELEEKLDEEIAARAALLSEYDENFRLIFNSSSDVLYDSNLVTGKVTISNAYEKEFGYPISNNMSPAEDWLSHIHPADQEALFKDYQRLISSTDNDWCYAYRILKADGSIANVVSSCIVLRNATGEAYRMVGSMKDVSKQIVLEEKLELEIRLKEQQIAEAMEDAKDTERSDIGKELHDNINQLLGASRLYLEMAKSGGANSKMLLSRSSEYTHSAIEEIRKLTRGLTSDIIRNLGLCEAINKMARDTMEVSEVQITCDLEQFEEFSVNDKFKLNIYRILQEQLNNILKHAQATTVVIRLTQDSANIELMVSDNGIGFDCTAKNSGIGLANIRNRVAAYSGYTDFVSSPGESCILTVRFPITGLLSV